MKVKAFEFGPFHLDLAQQQLRRNGMRVKLPVSRFRLLLLFVTRHGDLVTREEISDCLWTKAENVDVMSGINTAVNQLRAKLGDDPASPKFIETVVGAGYRFIAGVSEIEEPEDVLLEPAEPPDWEQSPLPVAILPATILTAESPAAAARPAIRRRWGLLALAAAVLAGLAVASVIYVHTASQPPAAQAELELIRVTGSGDIQSADISPDGNYVAFVRGTAGQQGLWLKQLATGRLLELATIGGDECPGVAFSPDGNYVYFARKKPLQPSGELYKVPFLGGQAVRLLDGVSGAPAISPDGQRVAFVRSTLETHGNDSIVTAALDGSGERVLASYQAPGIHYNRVTWALDGKSLVYPLQSRLMKIPAEGGTAQALDGLHWREVNDLRQLSPGGDLIVAGKQSGTASAQIFEMAAAGKGDRQVTHDLSNYTEVRATADGKSLLAVQDLILSGIQVLTPGKGPEARSLSEENQNLDGFSGLAWTPQGKIVFFSEPSQRAELMEMDGDGTHVQRLAGHDIQLQISDPAVSPLGDFIVMSYWSADNDANIWRMNMAGGEQQRLTTGKQDFPPSVTPDGKWVVYSSIQGDEPVLMKVAAQGGQPVKLTGYSADLPAVSPDGKWIACYRIPNRNQPASLLIVPIAGGPPAREFQLPETAERLLPDWTPDGRAVSFVNDVNGVGNVWQQPVGGEAATPVTHFTSGKIFNFRWSRDGRLALSRGTESMDAVLIRNFR
jgi:Tol biopolymer transport system component/DNA-binding winged helix-turn-helix (wHTH) protein